MCSRPRLHRKPGVEEEGVVVMGADRGAVELVVIDVLQTDLGIEPRPARRLAQAERYVVKLNHPAVAVGAVVREATPDREKVGVGSAPDLEVLTGQRKAVVAAEGRLTRQPK